LPSFKPDELIKLIPDPTIKVDLSDRTLPICEASKTDIAASKVEAQPLRTDIDDPNESESMTERTHYEPPHACIARFEKTEKRLDRLNAFLILTPVPISAN
jgi:hypothetical protein